MVLTEAQALWLAHAVKNVDFGLQKILCDTV